jgi:hypothetical protein
LIFIEKFAIFVEELINLGFSTSFTFTYHAKSPKSGVAMHDGGGEYWDKLKFKIA